MLKVIEMKFLLILIINRDEVAKEETWTGISHALNVALSNPVDDKRVIEILQEIFKVIRNLCAFSPANQSLSL